MKIRPIHISVILFLMFAAVLFSTGCVGGETKVLVDGYYQGQSDGLFSNMYTITAHVTATNIGDYDAKNVQTNIEILYLNHKVAEDTVYFGTVKQGIPVNKETILKVPTSEWANFNSKNLEMSITEVLIDGK